MTPAPIASWRVPLASWPDDLREAWGVRAGELQDGGLGWREAERLAYEEVARSLADAGPAPVAAPAKARRRVEVASKAGRFDFGGDNTTGR